MSRVEMGAKGKRIARCILKQNQLSQGHALAHESFRFVKPNVDILLQTAKCLLVSNESVHELPGNGYRFPQAVSRPLFLGPVPYVWFVAFNEFPSRRKVMFDQFRRQVERLAY